jgi:Fe-S-cluster-containing hydrogenase component 2
MDRRTGGKHAVKCDMCQGIAGGPACVRACPTGAAIRVEPSRFIEAMHQARQ